MNLTLTERPKEISYLEVGERISMDAPTSLSVGLSGQMNGSLSFLYLCLVRVSLWNFQIGRSL